MSKQDSRCGTAEAARVADDEHGREMEETKYNFRMYAHVWLLCSHKIKMNHSKGLATKYLAS